MVKAKPEIRLLFILILLTFAVFLFLPLIVLLIRSFDSDLGFTLSNYSSVWTERNLSDAIVNSVAVSAAAASIATLFGFILAYAIHCTRIWRPMKIALKTIIVVPMLLPTITFGFAIMYSLGNQGLLTRIAGGNLFDIYGFNGLLIGYVLYALPPAFLLIDNAFRHVDKRFIIVSHLMGDGSIRSFANTVVRPLAGAIGGAFTLAFVLSFTDFGIPASIGGTYRVVATELYEAMLGSIPDFDQGAVIAILMLAPAILGVWLLNALEKLNFHYDKLSDSALPRHRFRDFGFGLLSSAIALSLLAILAVMFVAPWLNRFPYDPTFTLKHIQRVLQSDGMLTVYENSLWVALLTALLGTLIAYLAALLNVRTSIQGKSTTDIVSMVTGTVPGMVLGISYLLLFNGSSLKGTFAILALCNIVHFFATPYLMAKNSLSKMNPSWETTGELLGDGWLKTVCRVLLPNSLSTIIEMFGYYFVNAMVTISGVIFLVSAQTSLAASKIKELQHFAKFNEIFVLSMFLFFTNLLVKMLCDFLQKQVFKKNKQGE